MHSFEIVSQHGTEDVATVYVARLGDGSVIEMVESVQPPIPREDKWVLIVSVLRGCPVKCPFCDANIYYRGRLSYSEIMDQIRFLVSRRHPDGRVPARKFKIQFARMGDPGFNDAVLDVLEALPSEFDAPGLMPSLSTVAPRSRDAWFQRVMDIKERLYPESFQFQFSIHTTDEEARRTLIPIKTLSFREMAAIGERIHASGGRRVTLNFATPKGYPLDPAAISEVFSPEHFMVKFTPINPTVSAVRGGMDGAITPWNDWENSKIVEAFEREGYEVVLSIGELRENEIGSNCGMFVTKYLEHGAVDVDSYSLVRSTV